MVATGVRPVESVRPQLQGLEGKGYAAYQSVRGGSYAYNHFQLHIDQIPNDPYASPGTGVFRVSVLRTDAGFSEEYYASPIRLLPSATSLNRDSCPFLCHRKKAEDD
jgi:predicted ABC-class ATPase